MKKARLTLSALGMVAFLGTALAFKATTFSTHVLYLGAIDQPNNGTACQVRTEGIAICAGGYTAYRASTTSLAANCLVEPLCDVDND